MSKFAPSACVSAYSMYYQQGVPSLASTKNIVIRNRSQKSKQPLNSTLFTSPITSLPIRTAEQQLVEGGGWCKQRPFSQYRQRSLIWPHLVTYKRTGGVSSVNLSHSLKSFFVVESLALLLLAGGVSFRCRSVVLTAVFEPQRSESTWYQLFYGCCKKQALNHCARFSTCSNIRQLSGGCSESILRSASETSQHGSREEGLTNRGKMLEDNRFLGYKSGLPPKVFATDPSVLPLKGCEASKISIEVHDMVKASTMKGDLLVVMTPVPAEESGEGGERKICLCVGSIDDVLPPPVKRLVELSEDIKMLDKELCNSMLEDAIAAFEFNGALGRSVSTRLRDQFKAVGAVGIGPVAELKSSSCSKIGVEIANMVKQHNPKTMCVVIDSHFTPKKVQCMLESLMLELNPDNRFKSSEQTSTKVPSLEGVLLYCHNPKLFEDAVKKAKILSSAVYFAMELVNSPPNYCNTWTLATSAAKMAASNNLEVKILEQEDIEKLKMGCFLGVAKGSMYPPKLIHLTYTGEGCPKKKIALIGKGICMDTGGYNVKSMATQIELMKIDMGGAAAVFAAAMAIGNLKPKNVEVHFIVAAAENMISDHAYRPGDILVASNGKTVEVGNTDAEGRLTLADALVYAEKLGVDTSIDIATLTGACIVALGEKCAGLFSPNDQLAQEILNCAELCGENMWRLPVISEYREYFDSKIADMNNISMSGKAGAIIAAVFLKEFVNKMTWGHIDIAGPAWKDGKPTGYGARTLVEYILAKSGECATCS